MLNALRGALQVDVERAKAEIEAKVGTVVTDMHTKLKEVDQGMLKLTDAGRQVMEKLEQEKAETITHIQGFVAEAGAEFTKHRAAIEQIARDMTDTQKNIQSMTTGLREELDLIRAQVGSLQTSTTSQRTTSDDAALKAELMKMQAEIQNLKSVEASRGSAAARFSDGGKMGGFLPWKQLTPKTFGSKDEQWRDWVDEVRDYFDAVRPGMKEMLIAAEKERERPSWSTRIGRTTRTATWARNRCIYGERSKS